MQDAHLHLQDQRFVDPHHIVKEMKASGVEQCVVNGTFPDDWDDVLNLATQHEGLVIPSFGLHPWHVERTYSNNQDEWKSSLENMLNVHPLASVGECGLDKWIKDPNRELQEDAFLFQLQLAQARNLPLSIHILKSWGWFLEILRREAFPERGFLLHSYNGSKELISELVDRGAYFSFSGYYLRERKAKTLEVFKHIPLDRLLVETDAPDMLPPEHVITHPLVDTDGKALNHPANLQSIANHLATALEIDFSELKEHLQKNFTRFFLNR